MSETYGADDLCVECGAHLADPHDPTCSRADADLLEE